MHKKFLRIYVSTILAILGLSMVHEAKSMQSDDVERTWVAGRRVVDFDAGLWAMDDERTTIKLYRNAVYDVNTYGSIRNLKVNAGRTHKTWSEHYGDYSYSSHYVYPDAVQTCCQLSLYEHSDKQLRNMTCTAKRPIDYWTTWPGDYEQGRYPHNREQLKNLTVITFEYLIERKKGQDEILKDLDIQIKRIQLQNLLQQNQPPAPQ